EVPREYLGLLCRFQRRDADMRERVDHGCDLHARAGENARVSAAGGSLSRVPGAGRFQVLAAARRFLRPSRGVLVFVGKGELLARNTRNTNGQRTTEERDPGRGA